MLTCSSPNKLFEGSLSLNSTASDPASLLSTLRLENVPCAGATTFPEINNNGLAGGSRYIGADIQFLGTMTNPLGLTLKPPPEGGADQTAASGGGGGKGGGSRLDQIQAQFRQKLASEKELKLRDIFEKSVKDADRRIERITGGAGGAASSSKNAKPKSADAESHSISSNGMMKEFFKERRDMEKNGNRNQTALPSIQTHLKNKRQQYHQQQRQTVQHQPQPNGRLASELKPPRYHQPKGNGVAALKPKPLSPIAPVSDPAKYNANNYSNNLNNSDLESGGEGFNSTYSLSSSNLHQGHFPTDIPAANCGNSSFEDADAHLPHPPFSASKVHLPPVKHAKKGRSPGRESDLETKTKKLPSKKQQKAAAKEAAMEAENMKYLDKIIEAERRKSAQRHRRRLVASENGAGDSNLTNNNGKSSPPDSANCANKRREDEIMRQINQKMAELDRLRSQNRDLANRSRGSSRGGTPPVVERIVRDDDDAQAGQNAAANFRGEGSPQSSPLARNQRQQQQQQQKPQQQQQRRYDQFSDDSSGKDEQNDIDAEEQGLRKKAPPTTTSKKTTPPRRPPWNDDTSPPSHDDDDDDDVDVDVVNDVSTNVANAHSDGSRGRNNAYRSSSSASRGNATSVRIGRKTQDVVPPLHLRDDDDSIGNDNGDDDDVAKVDNAQEEVVVGGGGRKAASDQFGGVAEEATTMPGDAGEEVDMRLVECGNCGRRFAEERIEKHEKACTNQKARKRYDIKKHRVQGQDHAQYALDAKYQKEQPKKETNWRAKREDFIRNIRYARQATNGDATAPPPPPAANPDYVQCPNCMRRFNETAAERHIPRCKDLKTKGVGQKTAAARGGNSAKTLTAAKPPSNTRRR